MKIKLVPCFLFVAGAILSGVGAAILFVPDAFHASNGIVFENDPSLMSEVRAPGGLLFSSGLVILASSFRNKLRHLSVALATLVYGTFGLSRILSIALDGMPSAGIVGATVVELFVAALGILIMIRKADSMKFDHLEIPMSIKPTANH